MAHVPASHKGAVRPQIDRITIHGSQHPMTDTRCRSILLRWQTAFRFAFSAGVTIPATGKAGVAHYYDETSFLPLHADASGATALMQAGAERTEQHSEICQPQAGQTVRLTVETDGLCRRFYIDGAQVAVFDNIACLADAGVRIGKRFTGAMVGVYALNGTEDFTNISYQAQG